MLGLSIRYGFTIWASWIWTSSHGTLFSPWRPLSTNSLLYLFDNKRKAPLQTMSTITVFIFHLDGRCKLSERSPLQGPASQPSRERLHGPSRGRLTICNHQNAHSKLIRAEIKPRIYGGAVRYPHSGRPGQRSCGQGENIFT